AVVGPGGIKGAERKREVQKSADLNELVRRVCRPTIDSDLLAQVLLVLQGSWREHTEQGPFSASLKVGKGSFSVAANRGGIPTWRDRDEALPHRCDKVSDPRNELGGFFEQCLPSGLSSG